MKNKTTVRTIAKLAPFKTPKAAIAKILAFSYAIAMAKFATASDALTAALAVVDARLTNINIDEDLELYLELISRRASIQQAIAASGSGGGGSGDASAANQLEQIIEAELTNTKIGEVQATPTPNTMLARLKAIADALVFGIKTAANSISVTQASDAIFRSQGSVAAGSTDSGNPLKAGGVFNTTRPAYSSGQRGDLQISARGGLIADYEDYTSNPNNINTVDVASSTAAGADGQNIITGNATNNSVVTVLISGNSSFAFLITGTWVGTLQFERSLDNGTTWTSIGAFAAGTNFIRQTTTLNGAFHGNASSSNGLRVRAIAWTSGVASIRILTGQGTGTITVGNPLRLMDGTSGAQATIKAASTAPVSTDTAIVVSTRDFAATSTISSIASSATSGVLAAANNNRKLVVINNDSTATLYIVLNASVASTTNYTAVLEPRQAGKAPSSVSFTGKEYSGEIRGIWDSANGFARITETV